MLRVAAYVAGGVAVLLAVDFVAASDFLTTAPAAQADKSVTPAAATPDRALKGDRLSVLRPVHSSRQVVAGGDLRVLIRTNPANVTVITKVPGLKATQPSESAKKLGSTVREPVGADPARLRTPEAVPQRKLLDGCDPSFSPVAAPSLAHITGRCIAQLKGAPKLAALQN
jgi:hypothetical protein